jgi:hypothetical protein
MISTKPCHASRRLLRPCNANCCTKTNTVWPPLMQSSVTISNTNTHTHIIQVVIWMASLFVPWKNEKQIKITMQAQSTAPFGIRKEKEGRLSKTFHVRSILTPCSQGVVHTSIISASSARMSSAGPQLPSNTVAPARRRLSAHCTPTL